LHYAFYAYAALGIMKVLIKKPDYVY